MDQSATIITLIIGGIAGWLAARVLKRTGFGVIGDIVVGMIGGFAGGWVWAFLHPQVGDAVDLFHTAAAAAVGALVLLILWRITRR